MSDYTITTDFGAKDSLPSGNAAKIIKGSEFTTEFTNIKTAIATKANIVSPTFTGNTALDGATTFGANGTSTFNGTVNFTKDVTFDTNTLFVDVSENRVGIGNVAPATALDVTGVITTDGLTSSAGIDVTGVITTDGLTSSAGIDITGTVTASGLTVDTNTLHVDATNNRVGIGTTSPASRLAIHGAADVAHIVQTNPTNSQKLEIGNAYSLYTGASGAVSAIASDSTLAFATSDTERMRIDSAGRVGIGTTDPQKKLHIQDGDVRIESAFPRLYLTDSDSNSDYSIVNNNGKFSIYDDTNTTYRMAIDSTGKVGIGTTSPDYNLDIEADTAQARIHSTVGNSVLRLDSVDTGESKIYFADNSASAIGTIEYHHNTNHMSFATGATTRMLINSSGKVGIGTTSPANTLTVGDLEASASDQDATVGIKCNANHKGIILQENSGAEQWEIGVGEAGSLEFYDSGSATPAVTFADSSGNLLVGTTSNVSAGSQGVQITGTGEILTAKSSTALRTHLSFINSNGIVGSISTSGSATAYNTSSDERLKQNIQDADDAGSKVDAIQIRQFDWKVDGSHQDYGVIAQELATVAPEAVHQPEDSEEIMGVDYSKLVPMLIKEVQSLRSRVAELENI